MGVGARWDILINPNSDLKSFKFKVPVIFRKRRQNCVKIWDNIVGIIIMVEKNIPMKRNEMSLISDLQNFHKISLGDYKKIFIPFPSLHFTWYMEKCFFFSFLKCSFIYKKHPGNENLSQTTHKYPFGMIMVYLSRKFEKNRLKICQNLRPKEPTMYSID